MAGRAVAVLIAAGPLVLVLRAGQNVQLTQAEIASWMLALTVASGVTTLVLSLWPVDGPVLVTGVASVITAPLGGHGLNLAAVMGAVCSGPEAHRDPDRRYGAAVAAGLWFIAFGLFGATTAALFGALPAPLIAAVAGLAMLPALLSSLTAGLGSTDHREGALVALLVAASEVSILGVGAPFWALLLGVAVHHLLDRPSAASAA